MSRHHRPALRRLARNWNAFAADDPLWSILTWDDKRGNRWEAEEFFATGRAEVEEVLECARAYRPGLPSGRALDFGCGVGRLSLALADAFDEVHGVDVAANMIDAARRFDPGGRVRYHLNESGDLGLFADGHFDFVYSSITLQHMPPPLIRGYLAELCRVAAPGGALVFQLPETPRRVPNPNPWLHRLGVLGSHLLRRVRTALSRAPTMDMYGLPRPEVTGILLGCGCSEPRVEPSSLAGEDWVSWLYVTGREPDTTGSAAMR